MSDSATPQIISHYQVDSLLGVGAMGSVYLGVDRRDGTLVAIKLIAQFLATDEEFRKRFEREAHVAALLRSPYAVRVLEYGVENGRVFMAMEYVDGPTVRELLDSGPLEPERATRIALQVARALEEAEARGIVHRDVKPDNIILGPEDTAKLADFGVARQDTSMLTQTGGFYGTASYAAPEQFEGKADNRSDIYALGATLYHMLLGRSPVQGDIEQARRRIFAGDIAFADLASWPQLRSVVEQAMKTDPAERYQSARQFAGALESALVSLGGSSPSAAATVAGVPGTEADWRSEEETLRLALKGPTTSLPFGKRYASLKYELAVTNQGQDEARVALRAADRTNSCRFSLPESVSVPAGATSHVSFSVKPRKRRLRGPNLTRIFTIAGSGGGGGNDGGGGGGGSSGGPPWTVSGRFDDASYGWLPLGISSLALVIAVAALLVATVSTGASSEDDDGLRIGLLMPFSGNDPNGGSYSEYGPAYLNAAAMAVEEINSDGGVLGGPIVLVQGDSGGNPAVGLPEAERLLDEERVQAIIGDLDTLTSTMVAERVTHPAGVVQLRPDDIGDDDPALEEADGLPFVFMTSPLPSLEGLALAQLVRETGAQEVCLISPQESYSPASGISDAFRRSVVGLNLVEITEGAVGACPGAAPIVINAYPVVLHNDEPGADNLEVYTSTELEGALARGTEQVFVSSVMRQEVPFPFPDGSPASAFDEVGWDQAAAVRGTALTASRQGEQFDRDFEARFFDDPDRIPHLRQVYDAVYLIALAAEKAGTTDPDAIRAAMRDVANAPGTVVRPGSSSGPLVGGAIEGGGFLDVKDLIARGEDIDYEGAAGPIEFDNAGHNVRGLVEVWRVDAQAQDFVTERVMNFDRSTRAAFFTDAEALTDYFAARQALADEIDTGITALYATRPNAFKGSVGQTKSLYPEYVTLYQDNLDRFAALEPPDEVAELHRQALAARESLGAMNHERLDRLNDATTAEEVDAIFFVSDPEYSVASEATIALCRAAEALATDHGIQFNGHCEEPGEDLGSASPMPSLSAVQPVVGDGCPVSWPANSGGVLKATVDDVPLGESDSPIIAAINCGNAAMILAGVQKSKNPLSGAFTDDFVSGLDCPPDYSDLESAILKSAPSWLSDHTVEVETREVWDHQSLEEVYRVTNETGRWVISFNSQSNGDTNWPCH